MLSKIIDCLISVLGPTLTELLKKIGGLILMQPYGGYVGINTGTICNFQLEIGGPICSNWGETPNDSLENLQDQSLHQGAIMSWNSNNTGETNFINSTNYGNQSGKGGWSFYNIESTTTPATGTSNSAAVTISATGQIHCLSVQATSDYRIKENVVDLELSKYNVDSLRPVSFTNTKTQAHDLGLIAHELQEQFPFLVSGEKDGEQIQTVNYMSIISILIKEMQELKKRVLDLETDLHSD